MIELPTEVIGFHGTSRDVVPRLPDLDIQVSDQHFEWLVVGQGRSGCERRSR